MIQEIVSMDDNGHYHKNPDDSQIVPSWSLNNDTSTVQSMKRCHGSSSNFTNQEISTENIPPSMQRSTQENSIKNDEQQKYACRIEIPGVPDEKTEFDQCCPANSRNRRSTTSSSSSDKSSMEIFDKKIAYFPCERVNLPTTSWYLYRIKISGENDLGFIVPCKLQILLMFNLYKNDDALEVQLVFLREIDYKECENQLEKFSRYIFEEVFDKMNTGLNSSLQFDMKQSLFKLLPCLLTQSDKLDYKRMASICHRKNKSIKKLSEINDEEIYIRLKVRGKHFYTIATDTFLPQQVSNLRRDWSKISVKRIEKPNIYYLKKCASSTNKEQKTASSTNKKQKTGSSQPERCKIKDLGYAPLNQTDLELIYKLPSVLARISQLHHYEQCIRGFTNEIHTSSIIDVHHTSIVTFGDYLETLLLNQSNVLPLGSLNYNLLSTCNGRFQLPIDLFFQSITRCSAMANTNMESLETLGDSFLKLMKSLSLYHQYPFDDSGQLSQKRDDPVSNPNLYQLSIEKRLEHYLNTTEIIFCGDRANWLPPGYRIDQNPDRYLKQEATQKTFADMIEALIGSFLISTDYFTTMKFMNWLDLDVIPTVDNDGTIKIPSVLRTEETHCIDKIKNLIWEDYNKRSFVDIETKINYNFIDKAYLMAAFTHSSCPNSVNTINCTRLSYVGNALLEFLVTRYTFITKKSVTPDHISLVRQDLLNNVDKASIMIVNDLHKKIICSSPKSFNNTIDKDFSADEKNVNLISDVFEALIAAVFFDSGYSLKVAWDFIELFLRQCTDLDYVIQHPNPNPEKFIHKNGGKIIKSFFDHNRNFFCHVQLRNGTQVEGYGKSKRWAQKSACKQMRREM